MHLPSLPDSCLRQAIPIVCAINYEDAKTTLNTGLTARVEAMRKLAAAEDAELKKRTVVAEAAAATSGDTLKVSEKAPTLAGGVFPDATPKRTIAIATTPVIVKDAPSIVAEAPQAPVATAPKAKPLQAKPHVAEARKPVKVARHQYRQTIRVAHQGARGHVVAKAGTDRQSRHEVRLAKLPKNNGKAMQAYAMQAPAQPQPGFFAAVEQGWKTFITNCAICSGNLSKQPGQMAYVVNYNPRTAA
jgi:hypothetical protein